MSDLAWMIIVTVIGTCIAYGLGLQVGYKRGYTDARVEQMIKEAEKKVRLKYGDNMGKESKHTAS